MCLELHKCEHTIDFWFESPRLRDVSLPPPPALLAGLQTLMQSLYFAALPPGLHRELGELSGCQLTVEVEVVPMLGQESQQQLAEQALAVSPDPQLLELDPAQGKKAELKHNMR